MVSYAYYKSDKVTDEEKARLLEILDMQTEDEQLLLEAVEIIKKSGAVEYAEKRAKEMLEDAWNRLEPTLQDNSGAEKLRQLSDFLINRDL